jgi:hypothetical protein
VVVCGRIDQPHCSPPFFGEQHLPALLREPVQRHDHSTAANSRETSFQRNKRSSWVPTRRSLLLLSFTRRAWPIRLLGVRASQGLS